MNPKLRFNPSNTELKSFIKKSNWSLPIYGNQFTPERARFLKSIYTELVLLTPFPADNSWTDVGLRHWDYSKQLDEHSKNDARKWCEEIQNWTLGQGLFQYEKTPKIEIDDTTTLDAYCYLDEDDVPIISISYGTLSCLDDFYLSLFMNLDFFIENEKGLDIPDFDFYVLDPGLTLKVSPHIRYFDYRKQVHTSLSREDKKKCDQLLYAHFLAFPHGDASRVNLSYLFTHIALSWIYFHEYAHIKLGHLDYLKSINDKSKEKSIRIDESKEQRQLDSSLVYAGSVSMRKVMEWEADILAAKMTISYWKDLDLTSVVGKKSEMDYWKWRAVLTSILGVIMLFEKANIIYGKSASYPEPRSRIYNVLYQAMNDLIIRSKTGEIEYISQSNTRHYSFSDCLFDISLGDRLLIREEDEGEILESSSYWRKRTNFVVGDITRKLEQRVDIVQKMDDAYWWFLFLIDEEKDMEIDYPYVIQRWVAEPLFLNNAKQIVKNKLTSFRSIDIVSYLNESPESPM